MEMMGLVVIVILITLGMLFLAQFALNEQPQKKIFTRKGLASSTMASLMKTTIEETNCQGLQFEKDLLEECARYKVSGYSFHLCNGQFSCDFIADLSNELLNATLGQWNKRYEYVSRLVSTGDVLVNVASADGGCLSRKTERDTSGSFFLNTDFGLVESVLYICE